MCLSLDIPSVYFSGEVKFHDPSEFAQNANQQQQVNNEHAHQTNHGHDDHRHGIGESVDKE